MPAHLIQAMPMLVLGLVALAWIIVRWLVLRRAGGQRRRGGPSRSMGRPRPGRVVVRDLGPVRRVHLDDRPDSVTLQVVRFYVPAIGAISLLGAWLVTRIPGRAWLAGLTSTAVITAMFGLGAWSFHAMWLWAVS